MSSRHLLITLITLCISPVAFSQNDWALKLDKDGIKVYTKAAENSPYKAVKTICVVDANLTKITAVLLDIKNTKDWVYSTKECNVLKQISPSELIYYSEVTIPWPVSNRDFIVNLKVHQDPQTKVVTVDGENRPTYLPEKKGIVRIKNCFSRWTITPVNANQCKIEYVLQVDPGGLVPAWLINMFATRGPYESFKDLRLQVKKPIYNNASLSFIKD